MASSGAIADTPGLISSIKSDADRMAANTDDVRLYIDSLQNVANAHVGRAEGTAEGLDYLKVLRSTLDTQVGSFNQNSQRLIDYSDMYATNNYVQNELRSEIEKTDRFISKLRNNIYASKQKSQEYIYQANRFRFMLFLLLFTVVSVLLVLTVVRINLMGLINDATMISLFCVLGVLYVLVMVFSNIRNSFRTRLDWNKFHWEFKDQKKKCAD